MSNQPSAWDSAKLHEQLALQGVVVAPDMQALARQLGHEQSQTDVTQLQLTLAGIGDYAASWGDAAALWLVLAVTKLIREVTAEYPHATYGCVPPHQFLLLMPEEHYQEIGHRCLTGYQELYDVLLRTHRKPSSPIWHRRAVVQHFPQLIVENDDKGDLILDDDLSDHSNKPS